MKDRRVGMLTYKGSPKPHLSLKKYRVFFRKLFENPTKGHNNKA